MPHHPNTDPEWDALGHTVLIAFARVRELEQAPRIRGGVAGKRQVRERYEARKRAWELLEEWGQAALGREVDGVSMPGTHVCTTRAVR